MKIAATAKASSGVDSGSGTTAVAISTAAILPENAAATSRVSGGSPAPITSGKISRLRRTSATDGSGVMSERSGFDSAVVPMRLSG